MKRIAAINDLSGFGRCSLTAAVPVISAMGIECCPLPTAVLSNQTGFDSFFCDDFTDRTDFFTAEWKKLGIEFDAVLTGYLASKKQVGKIIEFLKAFRSDKTIFVCDPVMADDGAIYPTYDSELCESIKLLASLADVLTPNLTELCILTGTAYETALTLTDKELAAVAEPLIRGKVKTVIVTGVVRNENIHNIVVGNDEFEVIENAKTGSSYSGTGDLFSSAVCGGLVNGMKAADAVRLATRFLSLSIADTFSEGGNRNFGVNFQKYLNILIPEAKNEK